MSSRSSRSSSLLHYAILILLLILVLSGLFYYKNTQDKSQALFIIITALSVFLVVSFTLILFLRKYKEGIAAESELRKLSRAVEQSPASIVITDIKGTIEYVNPKFIELTGYSIEEVSGKNPRILKSGLTPSETHNNMWNTILKGNSWSGEYCNRKKNGELYWEYATISPIMNEAGRITHFVAIKEDITERVKQQEALIESERRFRQLADSMPQLVWTAEPDGIVDYYNSRSSELDGISKVETGKWKWDPVVHPDDVEATVQAWNYAVSNGTIYEIAHRVRLKNGAFKWFLSRGIPIRDDQGKIIKWYGTATDIHLQKEIETRLNQTLSQLALSESKLKEAQKLAHIGSFLIDLHTNLIEGSDELYRILEVKKDSQLSLNYLLKNLYEEDKTSVYKLINKGLRNGGGIDSEFRYNTPVGLKYLKIVSKPIIEDGKVTKLFGTAIDITEHKKQEQKMQVLLAELTRSNKDLEQFAYTSSHDLQEPLRMIKSYAQMLELNHKSSLDNKAKDYLYFISEGASRMQQLVNDLLNYSRVTTTKQELELIDTNIILQSVMDDLKLRIAEECAVIKADPLPRVRGDKTQIRQLFQNLIQNAVKFRSDRNPEIHIKCEKRKHDWLFSISDNGIGIDAQFYERIFIIFQRLHDREKYSGTGVGLAICKKIVERHGGEIFVESEANKGTTFYFSLPL